MPIEPKAVTVFLDQSPSGWKRAAHAVTLAQRWDAHLIGVACGSMTLHPSTAFARGESAIKQVIVDERELEATVEAASALIGRHFRALCAKANVPGEFLVIRGGESAEQTILCALDSDLIVVGHPAPHGLPEDISPEHVLLASGVPLLIVPNAWRGETIGNRPLIGWNGTRQARRAVSDAMAFLVAAESVTVLVVDHGGHHPRDEQPGSDIARHLVWHGAHAEVAQVASRGLPIAQVILGYARRIGSDLLVVGAYSHARLRELLFGGTTRTLLARMPVPVLISR